MIFNRNNKISNRSNGYFKNNWQNKKKPSNLGGNKNSTVSRSLLKLNQKIKKEFNKWIIS